VPLGSPDSGTADRKGSGEQTTAEGGGGAAGRGAGGDGELAGGHPWQAHGGDETSGSGSKTVADKPPDGSDASGGAPDGGGPDGEQPLPAQAQKAAQPMTEGPVPHGPGGSADTDAAAATGAQPDGTTPGSDAVVARDFRYDKSNLPRYPNAVTKVGSGTSLPPGSPTPNANVSVSEILTTDGPQTVAAWYHDQLPPNWSQVNFGGLTMFWPPDRKADPRSVWILVDPKTNQTGAILWKPKQAAP
jgi:hypothetical protein